MNKPIEMGYPQSGYISHKRKINPDLLTDEELYYNSFSYDKIFE